MTTPGRLSAVLAVTILALAGIAAAADEPKNEPPAKAAPPRAAQPPHPAAPQALAHPPGLAPAPPTGVPPQTLARPHVAAPPPAPPSAPGGRIVQPAARPGQVVPAPGFAPGVAAPANLGPAMQHRFDFRGRDFGSFTPQEAGIWRAGQWHHGWHQGRFGWWWGAGGAWYFYDAPVYPYPEYVSPDVVFGDEPMVVYSATPSAAYWYYCYDPPGYYPYVPTCSTQWVPVPAVPQ
jgi:hypothetical protein